jgi:hypothetical protein
MIMHSAGQSQDQHLPAALLLFASAHSLAKGIVSAIRRLHDSDAELSRNFTDITRRIVMKLQLTSRTFRLAAFAVLALSILSLPMHAKTGGAPPPAPQVRMKWQSFISGPAGALRLASLKRGIAKMKSLDNSTNVLDFRRSWKYWANIHGYYGPQSMDGTVAQQIAYLNGNQLGSYVHYYQGITDQTPPDSVAATVWATCQHSSGPGAGQANFFGWHRMYLYYFEKVLRWAAHDNTLRLPYWDYTDPTQEGLPAEFRAMVSPLYDDKRDPGINAGTSS